MFGEFFLYYFVGWRGDQALPANKIGSCSYRKTEFRRFCEMKYLLEKETHNKNEDYTLKDDLNEIFLMVCMVCLSKFLSEHYEKLSESYVGRTPPPKRLTN